MSVLNSIVRKTRTLLRNPRKISQLPRNLWLVYDKIKTRFLSRELAKKLKTDGVLYGPYRLDQLPRELLNAFSEDFELFASNFMVNGTLGIHPDQLPKVCQKYVLNKSAISQLDWSTEMLDEMIQLATQKEDFGCAHYPTSAVQFYKAFEKFPVTGKSAVVLGSISPWVEAILLANHVESITTLEYSDIICNDSRIKSVNRMSEGLPVAEQFDLACSFSSVEHSGLGRYGDKIDPDGDIRAIKEIWSLMKPGGLLFLAVPISAKSRIEFNGHRIYSKQTLEKRLLAGFDLLHTIPFPADAQEVVYEYNADSDWQNQPIFVLQKVGI